MLMRIAALLFALGVAAASAQTAAVNWPPLPTTGFVSGRPATDEDVSAGNAGLSVMGTVSRTSSIGQSSTSSAESEQETFASLPSSEKKKTKYTLWNKESSGLNKNYYFAGFRLLSIPALDEEFSSDFRQELGKKNSPVLPPLVPGLASRSSKWLSSTC